MRYLTALLAALMLTACGWWDENPRNCANLQNNWKVEDLRRENGGWRFTTNDTIDGATGDVWLDVGVRIIDYGAEHCPGEGDAS